MTTRASNAVVEQLMSHTSVREYSDKPVSEEVCQAILDCAFASASSCFLQVTSIIRVNDPEKRRKLAEFAGNQKHVISAPQFWVFVADYHRNLATVPNSDLGWSEQLIVGCTDTGIAAQSAYMAMESFGLGGVYVGGIRNHIKEVAQLLELPQNTIPLMGLAFGYPAYKNEVKPRLPQSLTVMTDRYIEPDPQALEDYAKELSDYYAHRKRNPKTSTWAGEVCAVMGRERRPFVDAFLKEKGWLR